MYLIKYKNVRKVEEVDGQTMARKFPQRTVSFLETKLEWFMPHRTLERNCLPDDCVGIGPRPETPSKIHCEFFIVSICTVAGTR